MCHCMMYDVITIYYSNAVTLRKYLHPIILLLIKIYWVSPIQDLVPYQKGTRTKTNISLLITNIIQT